MKSKHLLSVLALAAAAPAAMAVPAYPGIVKVTQPDGSVIEVRGVGDEHFHYLTDAKGEFILERNDKGFLVNAVRMGEKLQPIESHVEMLKTEQNAVNKRAKRTLGKLDSDGRSAFPTIGSNNCLVILIEYSDRPFTEKAGYSNVVDFYNDYFNKKNFSCYDIEYSVIDYFDEVSGGKYAPHYDIAPVVTLPKEAQYYVGYETDDRYRHWDEAMSYALDTLDPQIDFSKYDNDQDGNLDFVYFIFAGYGQADSFDTSCIWPHQGGLPSRMVDGIKTGPYACSNELRGSYDYYQKTLRPAGIGTFCHEFGHVLGLPDLYDPNYKNNAYVPGKWSVMCSGCYNVNGTVPCSYTGYERWLCKWLEYEEIEDNTHYTLAPITEKDGARALRINVINRQGKPTSEYFVVENRNREGLDVGLPNDGMIVWYVYFSSALWTQNTVNTNSSFPRCTVVSPAAIGSPQSLSDATWVDDAFWPVLRWDGSLIDYIAPGTADQLTARGMVDTEKFHPMLTNIRHENRICTFDYNIMEQPSAITSVVDKAREKGKNNVFVAWEPVEGATSYELTVTRTTPSGTTTIVDNLENTQVGNVTNRFIGNLTTSQMNHPMKVKIRAFFNGCPSSQECVANFTPSELEERDFNGVETIEGGVTIAGGQGCVIAPEEAQVFNLAGILTGRDNLPAGVYVVRYGNRIQKVVVK